MLKISVIICTYNPDQKILSETLEALKHQTVTIEQWELIIIDNNSTNLFHSSIDISWTSNARIVKEITQGLTHARIRASVEAQAEIVVFVDDDNVLQVDYLEQVLQFTSAHPEVGMFGGRAFPDYQSDPPVWFHPRYMEMIGCRDRGNETEVTALSGKPIKEYPPCSPIGTGMVIRKECLNFYVDNIQDNTLRKALGRSGKSLISGEDNDMVLTILKMGYEVAYLPTLKIRHIIPARRVEPAYLYDLAYASMKSWVSVLDIHGIRPWPKIAPYTVPLRKLKSWIRNSTWRGGENYLKWRSSCGMLDGQSSLK